MGIFNRKSWQPKEVIASDLNNCEIIHVMSMYHNEEGMTGNDVAKKFTSDDKAIMYCEYEIEKEGKNMIVNLIDENNKKHQMGFLSDNSMHMLKDIMKKNPKSSCMRLNLIGNVDLIFFL